MSMDIEGLEYDALKDYDLKRNGPKVFTMEISSEKELLLSMMREADYFLYIKIAGNYTFIKNQYKNMI